MFLVPLRQRKYLVLFMDSVRTKKLIFIRSTSTLVDKCPGVPLVWDANDPLAIFFTYPWTRYGLADSNWDSSFPTANYEAGKIVGFDIRSTTCAGFLDKGKPCLYCRRLTSKVENLRKISKQPAGRISYLYQTHEQLTDGHRFKNLMIKDLQLAVRQLDLFLGRARSLFMGFAHRT
jgi:hypothetical protein